MYVVLGCTPLLLIVLLFVLLVWVAHSPRPVEKWPLRRGLVIDMCPFTSTHVFSSFFFVPKYLNALVCFNIISTML
jgi:hypothetical protein